MCFLNIVSIQVSSCKPCDFFSPIRLTFFGHSRLPSWSMWHCRFIFLEDNVCQVINEHCDLIRCSHALSLNKYTHVSLLIQNPPPFSLHNVSSQWRELNLPLSCKLNYNTQWLHNHMNDIPNIMFILSYKMCITPTIEMHDINKQNS